MAQCICRNFKVVLVTSAQKNPRSFTNFCLSIHKYFRTTGASTLISKDKMSNDNEVLSKRSRQNAENSRQNVSSIGTHNGTFHCDEVLACFMLRQLPEYENAKIIRSRDCEYLYKECDIIVDVGGQFDHTKKWYDHHQKAFGETLSSLRPDLDIDSKIRLSSAGLVYAYYGERIIESILKKTKQIVLSEENLKLVYIQIYKGFISEIDGIDNGVPMFETDVEPLYEIHTNISSRIGRFNPSWEDGSLDETAIQKRFEDAMSAAGTEFTEKVLEMGYSWINAREYVRKALESAKSIYKTGEILFLERFCPWKVHLFNLEKEYKVEGIPKLVIYAENEKSWRVAGVPTHPKSFLGRKFLPVPWRGLANEELSNEAGVSNLKFVHHTGFIGGATSKESALTMAIKSVEWENKT